MFVQTHKTLYATIDGKEWQFPRLGEDTLCRQPYGGWVLLFKEDSRGNQTVVVGWLRDGFFDYPMEKSGYGRHFEVAGEVIGKGRYKRGGQATVRPYNSFYIPLPTAPSVERLFE